MSRTPRRWTQEEDKILRQEALSQLDESDLKDWHRIAKQLPGRSNKDCRKRWCNNVTEGLKKGQWEEDEDSRLEAGIQKHGHHWAGVAQVVETRSADQCAKRWSHCLNPALDRSIWTKEEDQKLIDAVETHGHGWKYIQTTYYPGRAANHVKNRYTILSRKSKTQQQQPHAPVQDPSQPSDNSSTSASYEDDEISSMLEDSNSAMPDIDSHTTSPTLLHTFPSAHPFSDTMPQQRQQPQWPYSQNSSSSMPSESTNMFMSQSLDLSTHMPSRTSTQSGTEPLDPMHVDSNMDLAPTWSSDPTLAPDPQSINFFSNDMLTGPLSSSSSGPLTSASSYPPYATRPSPSFPSSGSLGSLDFSRPPSKLGKSALGPTRSYTSSGQDQGLSIATGNTTPVDTSVETPSNAEAIKEASKLLPSSSKLTLTIDDPNSDTVVNLMGVLAKSKAKIKLELS